MQDAGTNTVLRPFLRFHGGTKGFALCGVLLPSTPLWSVLALLCAATLRYSSLMFQVPLWMFQVPLWTSTKAREYPLWSLRALSPPVRCCLPAPCLLPLCGCPCVCVLSCPSLCCPPLLVPAAPGLRCVPCFLVPPCLLVVCLAFLPALRCSGLLPCAEFVFDFLGATQLLWPLAVSPPPPCVWSLFGFCASVFRGFVSWLCVGGPLVLVVVGVFVRGSRTRPEPWTGLHCSEFHWR